MKVGSLSAAELRDRLRRGITIQTGCFTTQVQTRIFRVAEGVGLLYADYPLIENGGFADFHVELARARGLRAWVRPQVSFFFDGDAAFKPLPFDQAFPMFEWGLNWCVSSHAHSYLMIHAAVVEKGGFAAMLPAPPGSGKSTLCAALVSRGWRLLSDEIALIRLDDCMAVPLPRPISLKNASIDMLKRYAANAVFSRPVRDTMKGTVAHMKAPTESVARAAEAVPVAWVIFPQYRADVAADLRALPRSRAFMRVADNAFNYSTLGGQGFATLTALMERAHCYEFAYSCLDDAVATFASFDPVPPT